MNVDISSLNYIKELFESNNSLLLNFSSYCVFMTSLRKEYGSSIDEYHTTITDEERKNSETVISNIKYFLIYSFKKLKALKNYLSFQSVNFSKVEQVYKKIRDDAVPLVDDIDEFIDYLNLIIVENKISELFENKIQEINQMYNENKTNETDADN